MQRIKFLEICVLLVVSFFLLINCATRKAPTGGPVDRIPPQVLKTNPANDSLLVPEQLQKIGIVFSERMEQSSLSRNVFISPPLEFEIDWRNWDEVDLILREPLLADQTYVISIASGLQDLRKNSMAASYQFAFSTGKALDHNSISGKVHGLERDAAVNLFAFMVDSAVAFRPDTLKPMYITKSGKNGDYRLAYMKDGLFRVMAVGDQNNNLLLDADFEVMGLPAQDVLLDSTQSEFEGLDFVLTKSDTSAPRLLSVRPVYRDLLEVRLTEPVLDTSMQALAISDSITGKSLSIRTVRPDKEFKNILKVVTAIPDSNSSYRLQSGVLIDSAFNRNDTVPSFYYRPKMIEDTVTFRLISHFPKDSSFNVHPTDNIRLEFSAAMSTESLIRYHILQSQSGEQISGTWEFQNLTQAVFNPNHPLTPDSAYFSTIKIDSLRDLRGKTLADSAISYYFKIVSSRELGEISGQVQFQRETANPALLRLKPLDKKHKVFQITADAFGNFRQDFVPDGKYLLEGWLDEDRNGRYSAGTLFPFRFAEPFSASMDTVKVRKRWETENIRFQLLVPERKYETADSLYQD